VTAYTAKSSLPYPSLSDSPNIPSSMQALAAQLDGILVPKYANNIVMNTANPSPTVGDMCYRTDIQAYCQYDGAAWNPTTNGQWVAYTPTWSGLSALGSSVARGMWAQMGKTIHVIGDLEWGTSSSLGTSNITVSLPIAAYAASGYMGWQGEGKFRDSSSVWHPLYAAVEASATTASIFGLSSSQTYVSPGTAGYTWGNSTCYMRFQLVYQTS
jgi:hypothetical protein